MNCERCGRETMASTMSYFNTDTLCLDCKALERAHPLFKAAQDAERAAVKRGERNFPGIGLPDELRPKAMSHSPQQTLINGKPAAWNDGVRELWALMVAAHFDGETRPVVIANYFTPRPYVDEYNRGDDRSGFTYTVGQSVCYHYFPRGQKV